MKFEFTDRFIIVTGGTKGIGKSISEAFLAAGGKVLATYGSDHTSAETFKNSDTTGRLDVVKCNVASYSEVEDFFGRIEENGDKIDILINNAGIRKDSVLAMMSTEDWNSVIDINLTGVFNMSKFAVMNM
ncbi:SDR family NAD(P)-dependent oxidoreductase, partial [bacterium]|nr:SDR family NAD(P)-dependent oxidoreductase [bacterium]